MAMVDRVAVNAFSNFLKSGVHKSDIPTRKSKPLKPEPEFAKYLYRGWKKKWVSKRAIRPQVHRIPVNMP